MNTETLKGDGWKLTLSIKTAPATSANLYYDDTRRNPWTFDLQNDNGEIVGYCKREYKTKAAAASAAAKELKK